MKKLFLMAAALSAVISLSACSDDDDNGGKSAKTVLVKQVIFTDEDSNESETRSIEYDDQGRISRITSMIRHPPHTPILIPTISSQ